MTRKMVQLIITHTHTQKVDEEEKREVGSCFFYSVTEGSERVEVSVGQIVSGRYDKAGGDLTPEAINYS